MNYSARDFAALIKSTYVRFLAALMGLHTRRHRRDQAASQSLAEGGYRPAPASRTVITPQGATVHLRPLRRDDRPALREFFATLTARSRQQRFLVSRAPLTEQELGWLLTLRTGRHWSWVAESRRPVGTRLLGVAQGYRDDDSAGSAEIAVAVLDAAQGQHLGRHLLALVAAEAKAAGMQRLHGYTLADNRRILGYAKRRGAETCPQADGTVALSFAAERLAADLPPITRRDGRSSAAAPRWPELITHLSLPEGS